MATGSPAADLRANVEGVRARIARAAERSGRPANAIRLVAVTKSVGSPVVGALVGLGVRDLGENRIDELGAKRAGLGPLAGEACWHMIGHLQRNKAKRFLESGAFLHSLDGDRLADEIAARVRKSGAAEPHRLLIEVNVSGEATKRGVAPEGLDALIGHVEGTGALRVAGLMTMAPIVDAAEEARPTFRRLRELRDRARERWPEVAELSMGMTQDFEVAIEEGATMVRIGAALFAGLGGT